MCTSTSVGVDNTSINIGARDSLKTSLELQSCHTFNGCPCHILHNAVQKQVRVSQRVVGLMLRNSLYRLIYTTGLINQLNERTYCTFCNQEYRAIVKNISTHWLSLEIAVQRSLKQLPSLTSYLKSECESQARFKRLQSFP